MGSDPVIEAIDQGTASSPPSPGDEAGGLTVKGTVRVLNLPPSLDLASVRLDADRARILVFPDDPNTLLDLRHVSIRVIAPDGDCRSLEIELDSCRVLEAEGGLVPSWVGPGGIVLDLDLKPDGAYTVHCVASDESCSAHSLVRLAR